MADWDPNDFPLPEWAVRRSDGNFMEVGAQLATRDGRRLGNAYVDEIRGPQLATVVTDMGSRLTLTLRELEELFHPPSYVMHLDEARASRWRDGKLAPYPLLLLLDYLLEQQVVVD